MEKPSFFSSLKSGFTGMIKGALALAALGLLTGGALGGLLGATELMEGGVLGAAASGAGAFAGMGVSIGGIIGAITGIVQSREVQAVDPQDIINVANISFAQGMQVGRNKNVSHEATQELKASASHFQDQLAAKQQNEALTHAGRS